MSGPHLVLIGMMGAGKTTVGRRLARRLDRPFLDSDELVEARTGRTVAEIFELEGEPAFRRVETEVLEDMLTSDRPAVIAAAGGAVLDERNRERLRARGTVVWLRADPALLLERIAPAGPPVGGHRPLIATDPVGTLSRLADERADLYRDTAHTVVDVDGLDADAVVEQVLERTGAAA